MFANIAIPGTGFQTFTYKIPERLITSLTAGQPVVVSLRKQTYTGVILEITDKCEISAVKLKEISGIINPIFTLTPNHLALIKWLADYYVCPVGDVLRAAYPPGVLGKTRMRVQAGEIEPIDTKFKYVYNKIKNKA